MCQLDGLRKYLKQDILRQALNSLPGDLNKTYDQILNGIDEDYIEDAFKILQWLVQSTRPLDLAEVAEVVAVGLGDEPQFDPASRLREPRSVLAICSSLVTTVTRTGISEYDGHEYQKGEVRLAHFSVKEYLLSARIRKGDTEYFIEKNDEGILAETCLAYLLHLQEPAMLTPSHPDDFPLAEYAANYWFTHAKMTKRDVKRVSQLGSRLLQSSGTCLNWVRLRDLDGFELGAGELSDRNVDRFIVAKELEPPLYYAALAGLFDLAKLLIGNNADVNADGGKFGYALQAAAAEGYAAVVRLLLQSGAQVNAQGGKYNTALLAACSQEHEDVVKVLLEYGADANVHDYQQGYEFEATALQAASSVGNEAIVRLLLASGARVDGLAGTYGTALQVASTQGKETIVKVLLEEGANVNAEGGKYKTALQAARAKKHAGIVKLLLDKGADDRGEKRHKEILLQDAAFKGHLAVVQQLLAEGVNVNALGGKYNSPLQAAAYGGHDAVVEVLLKSGADVKVRGGKFDSPLLAAALQGNEAIVKVLLEMGVEINAQADKARKYNNAIQAAAYGGHEAVVKVLLDNGADINLAGGTLHNALVVASWKAHEGVVKLLLKRGADVNSQGGEFNSALQAACLEGHIAIVKLLLENGADVNVQARPRLYPTALAAAAFEGQTAVARILIQHGIDVRYYDEAVDWAALASRISLTEEDRPVTGWYETVNMLHELGAGFSSKAFINACRGGLDAVVKLMLEKELDFAPDVTYYTEALEKADRAEKEVFMMRGEEEVSRRGFKAIINVLQEKIASLSE